MTATIPYPDIDPVALHLGPLAIRWYGLAYAAGFVLAWLVLRRMAGSPRLPLTRDQLTDLLAALALGVVVGGRAGWWLIYHRADGPEPWYEPVAFWHGGMSFHGGLVGVGVAVLLWTRRTRVPLLPVFDALALVAPIGLALGRLANFVNAELVGRPSSVPWAMVFPGDTVARHPSQLYEALLEGPVLLGLLWLAARAHPAPGRIAALFVIAYGVFRFAVEFTRAPDVQLGLLALGLSMGQWLSLAIVAGGALMWVRVAHARRS